jgi:hypothetical protein
MIRNTIDPHCSSFKSSWSCNESEGLTLVESEEALVLDGLAKAVHGSGEPTVGSLYLKTSLDGIHGLSNCHLSLVIEHIDRRGSDAERG